jgi:hypothetical protein
MIPYDPADWQGYDANDPADAAIINSDLIARMVERGDDLGDIPENPLEVALGGEAQ